MGDETRSSSRVRASMRVRTKRGQKASTNTKTDSGAQKYRKYLEEQMVKEAEDTAFVDEINKREEEKVWKARDDALQARQDARDYLMKLVDEGRQVQIAAKREAVQKEKDFGAVFASKFMDDVREGIERDKVRHIFLNVIYLFLSHTTKLFCFLDKRVFLIYRRMLASADIKPRKTTRNSYIRLLRARWPRN